MIINQLLIHMKMILLCLGILIKTGEKKRLNRILIQYDLIFIKY